jgi:hypothetical protein
MLEVRLKHNNVQEVIVCQIKIMNFQIKIL